MGFTLRRALVVLPPDAAFAKRFKTAGFNVEEGVVRTRSNGEGPQHVILTRMRN